MTQRSTLYMYRFDYFFLFLQCRAGEGACPDVMDSSGSCTNDVFSIEGSVNNGIQCVSFTRNFTTSKNNRFVLHTDT